MSRPETGPMQFGDDWCGVFIRGDNAGAALMQAKIALEGQSVLQKDAAIRRLVSLFTRGGNFIEPGATNVQRLLPYEQCQGGPVCAPGEPPSEAAATTDREDGDCVDGL